MKIFILKNKGTGQVANVTADSRAVAREWVVFDKGWKPEDVVLVEERPVPGGRS